MATKEEQLKVRLATVLRDLGSEGRKDPEAVLLIGSLASELIDKGKAKSWPALKDSLSAADYDKLLHDFQSQGGALLDAGEGKKAYAIQALGLSLVCRTQRKDFQMREGEMLLDGFIAGAVKLYRQTQKSN